MEPKGEVNGRRGLGGVEASAYFKKVHSGAIIVSECVIRKVEARIILKE